MVVIVDRAGLMHLMHQSLQLTQGGSCSIHNHTRAIPLLIGSFSQCNLITIAF
jgi:hypothetical protein